MTKIASPNSPRLVSLPRKDRLFEDFFIHMVKTTERIQDLFEVAAIKEQIFGDDCSLSDEDMRPAKEKLRGSRSWLLLAQLYDYAVEGIDRIDEPGSMADGTRSLVIDAGEVLALLSGEENRPSDEWNEILCMGDGRFALEDGLGLDAEQLALLANVDVRTVRNAVSSGALLFITEDSYISNDSARLWLMGRKGFKPTVTAGAARPNLVEVDSPDRFGAFLRQRHAERMQSLVTNAPTQDPLLDAYPGLTKAILTEVEGGVFRVPLSLAWPLADFYGIAREEFLECVMRVFFPGEFEVLSNRLQRSRMSLVVTSGTTNSKGGA